VEGYERIRKLTKIISTPVYEKYVSKTSSKGYKSYIETSVRSFIKIVLLEGEKYGIQTGYFPNYASIINFVHGCPATCDVKLTPNSIACLKSRPSLSKAVPRSNENEIFINYVKEHIKEFRDDLFFRFPSTHAIKIEGTSENEKPKFLESL